MCWDSTKIDDVSKLMNQELASMIFTDPPYNVNYKWQWKITWTNRKIENDNMSDENFLDFLNDTFDVYKQICIKEAWVYVFHSTSTASIFEKALKHNWFDIKNQLIWNKPSSALWWWDYRWKHEPFFYCSVKWSKTNFYWDRTHSTVIETLEWKTDKELLNILKRARDAEAEWKVTIWSMRRANVNEYVHPTQKPVELIEYALNNSSKIWDNVVDLFWWSGSTLVACEKRKRTCYTMELDPVFVQTIIKRYHEVTNWKKKILSLTRDLDINNILNEY
jgi:DNA modification methylase